MAQNSAKIENNRENNNLQYFAVEIRDVPCT